MLANVTAAQEEINSVQVRHEGRLKVLESREPRRAPTAPSRMRPGKLKTVRMLEKVSWHIDSVHSLMMRILDSCVSDSPF